jgi:polar amino acid transport system substrate-binding protein
LKEKNNNTGMNVSLKAFCLAIFWAFFLSPANAETFSFVGSHFPIISEETNQGALTGIGIDIARIIGEKLGYTIKIQLYPWRRAQFLVKTGRADVLIAPFKNAERETWMDFSEAYFLADKSFLFVKPGRSIDWHGNLSSLKGLKICVVEGWSLGRGLDNAINSLSTERVASLDICFKMLLMDRVDVVTTQQRIAMSVFRRLGVGAEQTPVAVHPPLAVDYNYFGFTKKKDLSSFKKSFDREFKRLRESGAIARLLKEKYGLENSVR